MKEVDEWQFMSGNRGPNGCILNRHSCR